MKLLSIFILLFSFNGFTSEFSDRDEDLSQVFERLEEEADEVTKEEFLQVNSAAEEDFKVDEALEERDLKVLLNDLRAEEELVRIKRRRK